MEGQVMFLQLKVKTMNRFIRNTLIEAGISLFTFALGCAIFGILIFKFWQTIK